MVMVSPVNEAFSVAMNKASRALRNGATYGVAVEAKGKGYTLRLIDARSRDHRYISVVRTIGVGSLEDIEGAVVQLSNVVEFDGIPVFLLKHQPDADYRNKWVLVDPSNLRPRETSMGIVESAFNGIA